MNTLKLNIVNGIVVVGLVAASMLMPLVAAHLSHTAPVHTSAATSAEVNALTG